MMKNKDNIGLILIDLQNDFLHKNGEYSQKHIHTDILCHNIIRLVSYCRYLGIKIIWIKSDYSYWSNHSIKPTPVPLKIDGKSYYNNDHLASAHFNKKGKSCCYKGQDGYEMYWSIRDIMDEKDIMYEKNRYSAFVDKDGNKSDFYNILIENGITKLLVGGVMTNSCVQANVCDATLLGFNVSVLEDCTSAWKHKTHLKGLNIMKNEYNASIISTSDLIKGFDILPRIKINFLGSGDTFLINNIIQDKELLNNWNLFNKLYKEINWNKMVMHGGDIPRLISIMGSIDDSGNIPLYRHPSELQPKLVSWNETIDNIRKILEQEVGHKLNHALIQLYRDGKDNISEHSDKTLDIVPNTRIVNFSVGAQRIMTLKWKTKDNKSNSFVKQKIILPNNSALFMGLKTNMEWYHSIGQDKRPLSEKTNDEKMCDGKRISITFRCIGTFLTPDGKIIGQGAKKNNNNNKIDKVDKMDMIKAFSVENYDPNFDKVRDKWYGNGFDFAGFNTF